MKNLFEGVFMEKRFNMVLLENMLSDLQLMLETDSKEKLLMYTELIIEGLKRQRLTGEKTADKIINKQLYDSLYPLKLISLNEGSRNLDLGSGAGLPGIPIKICQPKIKMFLLDANQRKIKFLMSTAASLGLDSIDFLHGRAEEWAHNEDHREKYDCVFIKAVAVTTVLAELTLPFLKVGGQALLYKGPRGDREAEMAEKAIGLCGGNIEKVWSYNLPSGEKRFLYLLRKVMNSPSQYPRSTGKPARKPLL